MSYRLPDNRCRYWLPAFVLSTISPLSHARVYTTGQLDFNYSGQALWGAEGLGVFREKFLGINIAEKDKTIGDISGSKDTIIGDTRTGFEVTGSIGPGKVGVNVGMQIGSGSLAVQYPVSVTLGLPDGTVQRGSNVSLGSSYTVNIPNVSLASSFANASGYEDLVYQVPASLSGKACFIGTGCSSGKANAGLSIDPIEMLSYNRNGNGQIDVWGTTSLINFNKPFTVTVGKGIPGIVSVGTEIGSVTVYTPDLNTQTKTLLPSDVLISSGSTKLMDLDLDLATLINVELLLPPPNASVKLGPAEASIAAYKLDATSHLSISQVLNFDPTVKVKLDFDHMVGVTENLAGLGFEVNYSKKQIITSLDDLANMKFKFNADTKVRPTFILGNTIHNLTTLDLSMDLSLKILQAEVDFGIGPNYDYTGFSQHLSSSDLGSWALSNKTFSLDMGSFVGDAFAIDVAGVDSNAFVWEGLSSNKNLSNAANWKNGLKPTDGENLLFNNHGSLNVAENDYLKQVNGINFDQSSSGLILQGIAISNSGGIVNQSNVRQTVALAQTLIANQLWDGGNAGLTVSGKLDMADQSLLLRNSQLQQSGLFVLGKTTNADLQVTDSSLLQADLLLLGEKSGSVGKLVLSHLGSVEVSKDLYEGLGKAIIRLEDASHMVVGNNLTLARNERMESSLEINGLGSFVTVGNTTKLADLGRLFLDVLNGGQFNTHDTALSLGSTAASQINILGNGSAWNVLGDVNASGAGKTLIKVADGGSLNVGSVAGAKRFSMGTGSGLSDLEVNDGGQVAVHGDLIIGSKASVHLNGGAITAIRIDEDGIPVKIENDRTRLAVDGVSTVMSGGSLTLDAAKPVFANGLSLAGELDVTHDSAIAGNVTMSNHQGLIKVNNGAQLNLTGDLIHNGADFNVAATASATLLGAVSGSGNFSGGGQLNFAGHYQPGNSPASISFGGDDVRFLAGSELTLEITGAAPGRQFDRLTDIDHLEFYGDLFLVFADNFLPAIGDSLDLFDFKSLGGGFDSHRIFVTGLQNRHVDFTQLASNGRVLITAVPLPTAWLSFATALLVWRRRFCVDQ